jgi:hypothetical protein
MITDEIASILFETGIEDTVQSTSLVLITIDAVLNLFRRIPEEI